VLGFQALGETAQQGRARRGEAARIDRPGSADLRHARPHT